MRRQYDVMFFDLDGTLTDPGEGITKSVQYALAQNGIQVADRRELYCFIGPPLKNSFMKYYGFSTEQAMRAIYQYREYFRKQGIFENLLYPGMSDLLSQLQKAGKRLIVATSKPELFARQILEHFQISSCFEYIAGADMEETRVNKDQVIRYALDTCHIEEVSKVLMVGDREYDVLGARALGMDCVGVLYGYGSREELENAGAAYLAESVPALEKLLLSL